MASVDHDNTAWVSFIDKYPVIGTVKEGVEWVLAAYYDDPSLCQEKKEQTIKLPHLASQNVPVEQMEMLSIPKTPEKKSENGKVESELSGVSGGASGMSGLYDVKEVPQKELVEYVTKVQSGHKANKRQTEGQMKNKKESEERKKIEEAVKKHLSFIGLVLTEPLTVGPPQSKRGEHVFNKDILKFQSKVLKRFTERLSKVVDRNLPDDTKDIPQLGEHTLDKKTAEEIAEKMVVNFDSDEFYVNSNAVLYGKFSLTLSTVLCDILMHIDTSNVKGEEKITANDIIDYMYEHEIYVDVFAKTKWINQNPQNPRRFSEVKEEVHDMYKNKRGYSWCIDTLTTIQQYFEDLSFNQH